MRRSQVRPEWWAAIGVVIVAIDLRVGSLDLFADPVGWGLVALSARLKDVRPSVWLGAVAAVASLAEAWVPYHHVLLDRNTGEIVDVCTSGLGCAEVLRYDAIAPLQAVAVATGVAVGTVAAVWMVVELSDLIEGRRHRVVRRNVLVTAAAYVVVWDLPLVVAALGPALRGVRYDIVWDGPGAAERLAFVGVVAALAMAAAFTTLAATTQHGHDPSEGWWGRSPSTTGTMGGPPGSS